MICRTVLTMFFFSMPGFSLLANNESGENTNNIERQKVLARKNHASAIDGDSRLYARYLYEPVATKRDKMIRDNRKQYSTTTIPEYRIRVKTIPTETYRDRNYKLKRR